MPTQEPPLRIHIASPCPANWNEMSGDDRARFCRHCSKHVYNLSAMSAAEAAALVREKEGNLCARFYQREDGTVLHGEDCPVGFATRQWRRVKSRLAAAASLVLLLLGFSRAQAGTGEKSGRVQAEPSATATPHPTPPLIMGVVCPPSTPSPTPKSGTK